MQVLSDTVAWQKGSVLNSVFLWEILCFKPACFSSGEDKVMDPSASVASLPALVSRRAGAAVGCLRIPVKFR